jgi:hypothetical protein
MNNYAILPLTVKKGVKLAQRIHAILDGGKYSNRFLLRLELKPFA